MSHPSFTPLHSPELNYCFIPFLHPFTGSFITADFLAFILPRIRETVVAEGSTVIAPVTAPAATESQIDAPVMLETPLST
jgi:hypothetical protein